MDWVSFLKIGLIKIKPESLIMSENPPPINLLFSKIVLLKEVVFPLLTIDAASMVFSTNSPLLMLKTPSSLSSFLII